MSDITKAQAIQVRNAVAKRFAAYILPGDEKPEVVRGSYSKWAVSWESGPYEWAPAFTMGTCCKTDWAEHPQPGVKVAGVFIECASSVELALYPDA